MEPLVHYSQRDPLYDTNIFSLDKHHDAILTETNHLHQDEAERRGYIRYKTKIIEKPVYIKEPEPIIEIIIKESNVSLPAPPPPPPQPKKKKEQVQVFFVKYKKNPNGGYGKDSIIYDKPVAALSPKLPEDNEEEELQETPHNYHAEAVTLPPQPSTTLRTVIRPDSETYHSPSGIKVTFGKEGFDYQKRSSKPEEFPPLSHQQPQGRNLNSPQQPTGRQLTSFSNAYFKPPLSSSQNFHTGPGIRTDTRTRQPHRPVSFPPTQSNYRPFGRPAPPQFQSQPNVQSQRFSQPTPLIPPQFSHSISHPPPAEFHNFAPAPPTRQPVPYKPFENFRPTQDLAQSNRVSSHRQQQIQFRPETQFTHQQLPHVQQDNAFAQEISHKSPQFPRQQEVPGSPPQPQFPKPHEIPRLIQQQPSHFERPNPNVPQQLSSNRIQSSHQNPQQQQNPPAAPFSQQPTKHSQQALPLTQQPQNFFQQNNFNPHSIQFQQGNLPQTPNFIPPGGELIPSLSKYETHISSVEPHVDKPNQNLSTQQYQEKTVDQFNSHGQNSKEILARQESLQRNILEEQRNYLNEQQKQQQRQQEQLRQFYLQNERTHQSNNNLITSSRPSTIHQATRQPQLVNTTPKPYYQKLVEASSTTTPSTEATTLSTTTKDPKILESQLPDEVPPELREQLLSSGILNNADISVLDYDKVGDIPLSALPPDQLSNFFNAGGAQQIAGEYYYNSDLNIRSKISQEYHLLLQRGVVSRYYL